MVVSVYVIAYSFDYKGSEHMRGFAEHPDVVKLFKETSLKRKDIFEPSEFFYFAVCICTIDIFIERTTKVVDPLINNPILLKFKDPRSYTSDVLSKIIPRILNPYGMYRVAKKYT